MKFQDGKVVFIKHGEVVVRVSINRIVRKKDKLGCQAEEEGNGSKTETEHTTERDTSRDKRNETIKKNKKGKKE